MAGIGFELYKILHKGTIGSIVKMFLLGAIIVAGPWLLSVLGIFIIQRYAAHTIQENPALFTITIVYVYAFSLFLFGGFHYVFSRYIADKLYVNDQEAIPTALLTICALTILGAGLFSGVFLLFNDFSFLNNYGLYQGAFMALFIIVNLIWLMLVYVALLKQYYQIFFSYLGGMVVSVVGVIYLGQLHGVAGALIGFTCGQFLIFFLLLLISLRSYPIKHWKFNRELIFYFTKFKYLFFIGLFFNLAIWIDKILFWFTKGTQLKTTLFHYYLSYDIPVFLAFLSMIPGLVYFLVICEPRFHTAYFKFVQNILQNALSVIKVHKAQMLTALAKGLRELFFFQGICTLGLIFNAQAILNYLGYTQVQIPIMRILLLAAFFHMLVTTIQIYLLYLELRIIAVIMTLIYFGINLGLTIFNINFNVWELPGLSYFWAALVAALYGLLMLIIKARKIDYLIFNQKNR